MKMVAHCVRNYDRSNELFHVESSEDLLELVLKYDEVHLYSNNWNCSAVIRKFKRLNQNARSPQDDGYYYVIETVESKSPSVFFHGKWVADYIYNVLELDEKIAEVEAMLATEGDENA